MEELAHERPPMRTLAVAAAPRIPKIDFSPQNPRRTSFRRGVFFGTAYMNSRHDDSKNGR